MPLFGEIPEIKAVVDGGAEAINATVHGESPLDALRSLAYAPPGENGWASVHSLDDSVGTASVTPLSLTEFPPGENIVDNQIYFHSLDGSTRTVTGTPIVNGYPLFRAEQSLTKFPPGENILDWSEGPTFFEVRDAVTNAFRRGATERGMDI